MPRDLRNEREAYPAQSGWLTACNGNCNQGRACDCVPNVPEVPNVQQTSHFTLSDGLMTVTLIGTMLALVFMGPMVQGWLA